MWYTDTTIAGQCFQNHVESLFLDHYFNIAHRSQTSDPDLTIEYIPSQEWFCVECKFKSNFTQNNKIHWATRDKIYQYQYFSKQNNIPTFIVIGVGNLPCNPKKMFCIPLQEASKYTSLFMSLLQHYERDPDKTFFWKNGNLE